MRVRSSSTERIIAKLASPTRGSTVARTRITSRGWIPRVRRPTSAFMEGNDTLTIVQQEHAVGRGRLGTYRGSRHSMGTADLIRLFRLPRGCAEFVDR